MCACEWNYVCSKCRPADERYDDSLVAAEPEPERETDSDAA
jgi:formate dehydrogenase maturation protein FdhE